jgi:DNA helicase II / ATP-dependent DNA helicase PcrA
MEKYLNKYSASEAITADNVILSSKDLLKFSRPHIPGANLKAGLGAHEMTVPSLAPQARNTATWINSHQQPVASFSRTKAIEASSSIEIIEPGPSVKKAQPRRTSSASRSKKITMDAFVPADLSSSPIEFLEPGPSAPPVSRPSIMTMPASMPLRWDDRSSSVDSVSFVALPSSSKSRDDPFMNPASSSTGSLARSTRAPSNPPPKQASMKSVDHSKPPPLAPMTLNVPKKEFKAAPPTKEVSNSTPVSQAERGPQIVAEPSPSSTAPSSGHNTIPAKRRLGMGRTAGGYTNKKFKPPS